MRVLVTGANGFIGSHLVRGLARAGHDVLAAVYGRAPSARELHADLTDPRAALSMPRVDAIVHAAGSVDPRMSVRAMRALNVAATEYLLATAARQGVRHFVHLSSVAVYGPLTLGEHRREETPRLGRVLGLPYMRTKAEAEVRVERSGVPFTLLRAPVVIGRGDTVISGGFLAAHRGRGLPLVPGARVDREVSLVTAEGLASIAARVLDRGPLDGALHVVDFELTLHELYALYARALGGERRYARIGWADAVTTRNEVGLAWLIASARFGQHYTRDRLVRQLGYRCEGSLETAIESGLSSLQGGAEGLF